MDEKMKQFIIDNKQFVEIFQWAVMNAVASVVYSDYIASIKQKQFPVRKVLVPSITDLRRIMAIDGPILNSMPEYLHAGIMQYPLLNDYTELPMELDMLKNDTTTIETLLRDYIIPNVSRRIPETIIKKFGLEDQTQQVIREDREITMFSKYPLDELMLDFISTQTALQLYVMLPSVAREKLAVDNNVNIILAKDPKFIVSIANDQAVCPILINSDIMNYPMFELIKFVTGTSVKLMEEEPGFYINTLPLNMCSLIHLLG